MSNINGELGDVPGIGGITPPPPVSEEDKDSSTKVEDTLSPSQVQALLLMYFMDVPNLPKPVVVNEGDTLNIDLINAQIATRWAEIGSGMWDKYLDQLEEESKKVREYLRSPQYEKLMEQSQVSGMSRGEIIRTQGYQRYLNNLPGETRDIELQGVTKYLNRARDEESATIPFMAVSFAITTSFIGDYMNIVDVASTGMVGVNPIQDAVAQILPQIPQQFQEAMAITINLFAIGLIDFSNVQVVGSSANTGQPPASKDAVIAFARNVLETVKSNEVNYLLMALLINTTEEGAPISEERIKQLSSMAKIILMSIALAALYLVEAKQMTAKEFVDLVNGKLGSRSEEETQLVAYLQQLRGSGLISESEWENLTGSLGKFFEANPGIVNRISKITDLMVEISKYLAPPEQAG
ncbi:MAG: hypothetical protein K940chlam7_00259 [Chlamydiae bacterium]|nr:hypothetical protein [Chlamydiota bacterium]